MEIIYQHFDLLSSTNDWGKAHLKTFPHDALTVISADEQQSGRGQYGRRWISPKRKNIYASFCFFINENQQDTLSLTHVLAISTSRYLEKLGVQCKIKWPNDLLVNGRKISGILCETEHLPPYFGVVIGLGLNVNASDEILADVGQPATSVSIETEQQHNLNALLSQIAQRFSTDLTLFFKKGFEPFLPSFRELTLSDIRNQHIL